MTPSPAPGGWVSSCSIFSAADAVLLKDLPFRHRDPFDRMLVVQSMARNVRLMSADSRFTDYGCRLL
ncbi:MAG: hypothetical protein OXH60_02745 [Rhodospirillales bacterium]|nr:hypothetical protein [Rhodospirillales bacterium]